MEDRNHQYGVTISGSKIDNRLHKRFIKGLCIRAELVLYYFIFLLFLTIFILIIFRNNGSKSAIFGVIFMGLVILIIGSNVYFKHQDLRMLKRKQYQYSYGIVIKRICTYEIMVSDNTDVFLVKVPGYKEYQSMEKNDEVIIILFQNQKYALNLKLL